MSDSTVMNKLKEGGSEQSKSHGKPSTTGTELCTHKKYASFYSKYENKGADQPYDRKPIPSPQLKPEKHKPSSGKQVSRGSHVTDGIYDSLINETDLDKSLVTGLTCDADFQTAYESSRVKMLKRFFQVASILLLPRCTAAVAIHIADRYVFRKGIFSSKDVREISAAALVIAAKLVSDTHFSFLRIANVMSVSLEDLKWWETDVMHELKWDVGIITPYTYVDTINKHLASLTNDQDRRDREDLQMWFLEIAAKTFSCTAYRASSIAFACVFSAVSIVDSPGLAACSPVQILQLSNELGVSLSEMKSCVDLFNAALRSVWTTKVY